MRKIIRYLFISICIILTSCNIQSAEIGLEEEPIYILEDYVLVEESDCYRMYRSLSGEIEKAYVYHIIDIHKNIIYEGYHYTGVNFHEENHLVTTGKTMGIGVYENQYFDVENSKISSQYYDVVFRNDMLIVYGDIIDNEVCLVIHDIFDKTKNAQITVLEDYPRKINFAGAMQEIYQKNDTIFYTYLSSKLDESIDESKTKTVCINIPDCIPIS